MNQLSLFLWIYTRKCQLKKGRRKQSAASLQSFQFQFEVIVFAVLLAPLNNSVLTREHIFYARRNRSSLAHCYGCFQINVTRKHLKQLQMQLLLLLFLKFDMTLSYPYLASLQASDKNVASQYGNGAVRTNDWVASIETEQKDSGNRTNRTNDQPPWVATLDLCQGYILWKDEMV